MRDDTVTNILEMKNISKQFFGTTVLDQVNFTVRAGEVHILLGENGAGKSTLIKILSGAYSCEKGEIWLDGVKLKKLDPKTGLALGISVIYQEFNLFPELSVCENIFMGKMPGKGGLVDRKQMAGQAAALMEQVGLTADPWERVGSLSVGQQQMIEIAKALANDVRILVLDEPTAALTDRETEKLFQVIRNLRDENIGIIYISHRMSEFFRIGDRCTVMRDGKVVNTIGIAQTNERSLTRMMVGHDVIKTSVRSAGCGNRSEVLSVQHLSRRNVLKDVSFSLSEGEIVGITGLIGSGKAEIGKCILGLLHRDAGTVLLNGKELSEKPGRNIRQGIAYVSDDRKEEGLIQIHSLEDNIALPNLDRLGGLVIGLKRVRWTAQHYIEKLHIKADRPDETVQNLSGGNQQKVVIAKWLLADADLYIFHEPTRGIDVGAREEIYRIIREITEGGAAVLLISSDIQEILQLSDRVIVMKDGRIRAQEANDDTLSQRAVLNYAMQEEAELKQAM